MKSVNRRIEDAENMPTLSELRYVIVIAAEVHRSQYDFIDGFVRYMCDELAPRDATPET